MRVLILGGTGLISTAIARGLLEKGDEVVLYNRGKTPSRLPAGATTLEGDRYSGREFVDRVKSAGHFDAIIDMIGYKPADVESLMEAAEGATDQVIFCSTVDVYRKPATTFPYTEDETLDSLSDYGNNKIACERLVAERADAISLPWTIIRPAATYGEGGTIIHTLGWNKGFLDRLRRGLPVIVMGDGTGLWTMCHVDDCARAFIGALKNERAYGRAYHATGEEWITWNRFHEIVAEAMGGPPPQLVHIPTDVLTKLAPEETDITRLNFQYPNIYDNSAAIEDLGFAYTIPFLEGAKRTIAWAEENGKIETAESWPRYDRLLQKWEEAIETLSSE